MQKTIRILVILSLLLAVFGFLPQASVKAEAYATYVSGITMVNLSSAGATATITYYRGGTGADAGQVASSAEETLAGNAIKDYAAIPVSNFRGAIVISSDQPLGAMSTITGGSLARGSYVGSSEGSMSTLLPFLAKNHGAGKWNTWFAVQNTGAGDTTVTVDYAGCAGTSDASSVVKAGASVIFDQATAACLGNGITSAVVTSNTEEILAVVSQESTVTNTALVSSGFVGGTIAPVIPLVNANNPTATGWRTAITIMNTGDQDTVVKLTYKRIDGSTCYEKQTVPTQKSVVFGGRTLQLGPATGVESNCAVGARLVGAAYLENPSADNSAQQPLVAIINQDRVDAKSPGFASAYGSFDATKATPQVVMPLIMDNNGQGKWGTSFNVMNVGTGNTNVRCTFGGSSYVATAALTPNGVFEDLQRGKLGIAKTSAVCTAYTDTSYTTVDSNAKIVAVVNERAMSGNGDLLLTYEAISTQP